MLTEMINPDDMYDATAYGFSHAVASSGGTTIYCAGQVAWDEKGELVGPGDLAAQATQVCKNLKRVLQAAGATPQDVVRLQTYVINHVPDKLQIIGDALSDFYGGSVPAPNTLVGVPTLALPEFLIEINATAVIG